MLGEDDTPRVTVTHLRDFFSLENSIIYFTVVFVVVVVVVVDLLIMSSLNYLILVGSGSDPPKHLGHQHSSSWFTGN